jgi:putative NADPH-quinone reductase
VFIFPVWWYSVPATLKNFLDQNFTSGFAYVFTKVGSISGLLQPRTARLFSTSGGPSILYRLHLLPYAKTLQKTLSDCGIKIVSKTIFGPRHGADPVKEEQWLQVVRKAAGK